VLLDTAGTGGRQGVLDVTGLAALGGQHPGLADACLAESGAVTPDSPGDILYTSGTTGLPRGS
jgi:long-subunit acyl-CoA synthetase (AMP-forming)